MSLDILLPFHRYDHFLLEALNSIFASDYKDFNLILIDDRPKKEQKKTDFLTQRPQISLVRTDGLTGYGNALKVGTQITSSDAIALMNSDDIVSPNRFSSQLELIQTHDISITKIQKFSLKRKNVPKFMGDILFSEYHPIFLNFGSYGADATWCMRREWWDKNAFFDNMECLDWRIALSSFQKSKIGFINKNMYFYRKHNGQTTFKRVISKKRMEPLFKSWKDSLRSYDLESASYELFSFIATPWNLVDLPETLEIISWIEKLNLAMTDFPREIRENINHFVARRYLLGVKRTTNNRQRVKFITKSSKELLPISKSIIKSILQS